MANTTTPPGRTSLQRLMDLSDQLALLQADAAATQLMAGDLVEFFETANTGDPDDVKLCMIYMPETEIRAGILQGYTIRTKEKIADLFARICSLVDSMKQESQDTQAEG